MTYDEQMEKESSERDALMQKFLVEKRPYLAFCTQLGD